MTLTSHRLQCYLKLYSKVCFVKYSAFQTRYKYPSIEKMKVSKEINVKVNETFKADKGFVPPIRVAVKRHPSCCLGTVQFV